MIKEARALSMRINAWEWRWPLNTYRNRDASKLSRALLDRLAEAEAMSLDDTAATSPSVIKTARSMPSSPASARHASASPPHRLRPWGLSDRRPELHGARVLPRYSRGLAAGAQRRRASAGPAGRGLRQRRRQCRRQRRRDRGAVLKRRYLPRVPTLLVRRSLPSISFSRKLAYTVGSSPTLPNSIGNRDLETVHDRKCVLLLLPDTAVTVGRCRRHHQANGGLED